MSQNPPKLTGIIRNDVIVPDNGVSLPKGGIVEFEPAIIPMPPEWVVEIKEWEQLGDEAWAMSEEWEKEEGVHHE